MTAKMPTIAEIQREMRGWFKKHPRRVFGDNEGHVWRLPEPIPIDVWCERNLVLTRMLTGTPGPISFDVIPFAREILRALADPEVEEVTICSSAQVAKTTIITCAMLYFLSEDPGNAVFAMDTEDHALEYKEERVEEIILHSPVFKKYIKTWRSQSKAAVLRLNGQVITFRGSNSPGGLASKGARRAFADEIDKWPMWAGKEADPLDLLRERLKSYSDSKFFDASTPTNEHGRIWQRLQQSSNERYHVPCPHCGAYQVLVFGDGTRNAGGIKWPSNASKEDIADHDLAWYECAVCHGRIDEKHKRKMVRSGVWAPFGAKVVNGEVRGGKERKIHRGFHIWAGYSMWPKVGWSRIAAEFLRSKKEKRSLMNFRNSWLGETWKQDVSEVRDEHLQAAKTTYPTGTLRLPEGADWVTYGVDVQSSQGETYHYYVVRAWGARGESWLIDYGVTTPQRNIDNESTAWIDLRNLVYTRWETANGNEANRMSPVVDSGYRTAEVCAWCSDNFGIAYKGMKQGNSPLKRFQREFNDQGDTVDQVHVNPDVYKEQVHRMICGKEGKWHIPDNVSDEYLAHMTAEHLVAVTNRNTNVVSLQWRIRSEGLPNHFFDCEVYALVGAMLARLTMRDRIEDDSPHVLAARQSESSADDGGFGQVEIFS